MRAATRELPRLSRVDDRTRVLYVGMGCALDADTEEARTLRAALAREAAHARILGARGEHARAIRLLTEALSELERTSVPEKHRQRQLLEMVLAQLRAASP